MPTCIIQSCPYWKLGRRRHPDISLHAFPSTARRIRSWLERTGHRFKDIDAFIGRILETRNDGDYWICSAHFANDSYRLLGGARVLKANAMPTIFPAGCKLIREACRLRTTRKTRLACRRNLVKPPKPGLTSARTTPALTKTDVATQTQGRPSTVHQGVQIEELYSQSNNTQDRSSLTQPVTLLNDENCQSEDMAQNVVSATPKCEESRRHMTEKILNLTLEIIYLLTRKRPDWRGGDQNQSLPMKSQTPFLTVERNDDQKILEVTQKIIELLTGEVPVRGQDVSVYFSMEEWEYVEGHRDLYKDVMMENRPALTSPDSFLVENSASSSNPWPVFNDRDKGPHFSQSPCGNLPQSLSACVKEEIFSAEEHSPSPEISTTRCHRHIPPSHVKEELLLAEEHLRQSKISAATQQTTIHIKGHLSVKDWLPECNISPPTQHTQPAIIYIKERPLSDEEHLVNPKISSPTHHRQSQSTHVVKGSLSDEEHLLNPKIFKPIHHTQPAAIHIKQETLPDEEHLPNPKISSPIHHRQPRTIHVNKGPLSDEEHLNCKISSPTHNRQSQSTHVVKGSLSEEHHLIHPKIFKKNYTQPAAIHIKEETLPDKDHLPNPKIAQPTHRRQHRTIHGNKGPLSDEEHHLNPKIFKPIHHTQPTTIHIKEETLPDEEHLPNPKISQLTDHRHCRTIHLKEPLSEEEHLLNPKIFKPIHHTQPITIYIKEESLSDEELLNSNISPPTHQRQSNTQPTTIHIKEETQPDKEYLPNPKISPPIHHRQPRTIHVNKVSMSDEDDLLSSEISTPKHHTEPTAIHIKEGPLSAEEHLPHEMDYTTIIIEEDSMSSDEEHPSHSSTSISQGHCTFSHARKGPPSSEEEQFKYSNLYLTSSSIQYIPVRINDDFLARQQRLQQSDLSTHPTKDLVEEVPILYEDGVCTDSSAPECDGDLSIIPVNLLPAGSQLTFLSDPDFSERLLFCPECGKSFTDKARVEAHLRSHWGKKPYCCSVCLKGFCSKSKLAIHQMMHSGEKPYACSECGKRFAQNAYLQRHIRGHTGEKPFPCSICGKCFACRSDMVKHEFTHTGARPHPCALCGKRFTKKSHLNRHMRIHTGEKPFFCPDCGRSFGCNSDMVSHQRIHQGLKPFSCSECGKSFLRKQDAQRHQTIHR